MNFNKRIFFGLALLGLFGGLLAIGNARADQLTTERETHICAAAAQLTGIANALTAKEGKEEATARGEEFVTERVDPVFQPVARRAIAFGITHKGPPGQAAQEFFDACTQPKA